MDTNPDKPPPFICRFLSECAKKYRIARSGKGGYSYVKNWKRNFSVLVLLSFLTGVHFSEPVKGQVEVKIPETMPEEAPLIVQENSLISLSSHSNPEKEAKVTVLIRKWVVATGYSSTIDQCDEDPWMTASGSLVHEGIVAANFLPFGTKIRLPEVYGKETFVVKDRMNKRVGSHIDIWFPTRQQALNFGTKTTYIEILETK